MIFRYENFFIERIWITDNKEILRSFVYSYEGNFKYRPQYQLNSLTLHKVKINILFDSFRVDF